MIANRLELVPNVSSEASLSSAPFYSLVRSCGGCFLSRLAVSVTYGELTSFSSVN